MRQNSSGKKVAIIGGAVTGVAAFIKLVRSGTVSSIEIIDPDGIANSMAFNTSHDLFLCNTSVQTMSVLDEDMNDFLHYLQEKGITVDEDAFVPRSWVSDYLRERYAQYRDLAQVRGIEHRVICSAVRRITVIAQGNYQLQLDEGDAIEASDVLICTGNGTAFVPPLVSAHAGAPGVFSTPYPAKRLLDYFQRPSRVLVLGSRLSAIDSALLLCGAGHQVLMASPSGRLPGVRTGTPRVCKVALDEVRFAQLNLESPRLYWHLLRIVARSAKAISGRSLREQVDRATDPTQRLRGEVALASGGATDWQNLLVHCMDLADMKLRNAPPTVRVVALQNCWEAVGRYLFAVPLQTATTLLRFIDEGLLQLASQVPQKLEWQGNWQVYDSHDGIEEVDAVVCATGFHKQHFHAAHDGLELQVDPLLPCTPPYVSAQLQVSLPGSSHPEKVWMLGVASYLAAPMVNSVYQSVRQASETAQLISDLQDSTRPMDQCALGAAV